MISRAKRRRLVAIFISALTLLTLLGTLFVFEASTTESLDLTGNQFFLVQQHLWGLALSLPMFLLGLLIPPRWWIKLAPLIYVVGLIGLVLVFVPGIGLRLNGAARWISLGPLRLQPVELMKFGIVTFFAGWLSKHQRFSPLVFWLGLPVALIFLQPDVGSLIVASLIGLTLYFVAGGNLRYLLTLAVIGLPIAALLLVSSPYRIKRLTTFFNPDSDPLGASFHIRQISLALGRGGWLGQGLGNSSQKFSYVPEASTDSIFAIIAEEVGFVGGLVVLSIFWVALWSAQTWVKDHPRPAERLLGLGLIIWLAWQLILNLSAVVGLVPLTGVPLPWISYGRSAQLMLFLAAGILIRLARQPEKS